jgi:diguanylate cyclase (GGDEF)-like protein
MSPEGMMRAAALILWLFAAATQVWAVEPLRLGVLAIRPHPLAMAQWQPLADYLGGSIGRPVELAVYGLAELDAAVAQNRVDVLLTNPAHYVRLQHQNGLAGPLVTLVNKDSGHELQAFGGVIFTRADATINTLADLANRRIASIRSDDALGGYGMQALELIEAGVAPPQGERRLVAGKAHDEIVEAVLAGRADAGFVRSGVIEAMVREGKLDAGRIKIINRQKLPAFPYASSTRLYPEWPLAVMPNVNERLARRLTIALLSLSTNGAPARADLPGFANPASYAAVENLMRRLRQPPFDAVPEFTLTDLWAKYALWITALVILLQLLALAGIGLAWQNRRVRQARERLEHIAHHDTLTSLPNRLLLGDRLHQSMAQAQRRGQSLALAYLDLDGFKEINDRHGHDVGDELLIAVAQRLKAALREGDSLARIGGDEFIAVLVDLEQAADCGPVLDRLLLAASDPVTVGNGQVLKVSASIGVTFYPQDDVDADKLLRHADHAMYLAKQSGRNRYCFFDAAEGGAVGQA